MASYYGSESGSQTASGQRFNPSAMTAAHRSLPFGTKVRVTNKRNGKSVIVTINDRGPFIRGRIIDLSTAAAGIIGMRSSGVAPVTVEAHGRQLEGPRFIRRKKGGGAHRHAPPFFIRLPTLTRVSRK